ncbi:MAG: tetratricopeptide repeat protein [Flavitalea sp.]
MANEVKHTEEHKPESHSRPVGPQEFWEKNSKSIAYGLGLVVLLVAGYFAYKNYFLAPKEQQAADAMWKAEQYYRLDSAQLALNGDGPNPGFLRILSKFSGTKSANLAKFYAASSYMKLGDFNNAIKYLKDFSTDDKLISVRATGLLGDAYAETGNKKEAVESYKKAGVSFDKDNFNSPEYLFRAGLLYQDMGNNEQAIEMFKTIKEKYPTSERGAEIDKYLARLGYLK